MNDPGCPHPESDCVDIDSASMLLLWCSICGSLRVYDGTWRAPAGIVLPGWTCPCGVFNGHGKEPIAECRHCGGPRRTI